LRVVNLDESVNLIAELPNAGEDAPVNGPALQL
jgi:hypothetical protein